MDFIVKRTQLIPNLNDLEVTENNSGIVPYLNDLEITENYCGMSCLLKVT